MHFQWAEQTWSSLSSCLWRKQIRQAKNHFIAAFPPERIRTYQTRKGISHVYLDGNVRLNEITSLGAVYQKKILWCVQFLVRTMRVCILGHVRFFFRSLSQYFFSLISAFFTLCFLCRLLFVQKSFLLYECLHFASCIRNAFVNVRRHRLDNALCTAFALHLLLYNTRFPLVPFSPCVHIIRSFTIAKWKKRVLRASACNWLVCCFVLHLWSSVLLLLLLLLRSQLEHKLVLSISILLHFLFGGESTVHRCGGTTTQALTL